MGALVIHTDKANASLGSDISSQVQQRLLGMNRVPANLGQQIRDEVQSHLGNGVTLASSSETFRTVKIAAQPNTLTATFTSRTPNKVLIDIGLYMGNEQISEQVTDNVSFAAGETKTFTATVAQVYQQTDYHWSVGIYTPGKGQLLHQYDSVQTFNALYDVPTGPTISIVSTDMPHAPVPQGQTFNVTLKLISAGGDSNNLQIVVALDDIAGHRVQKIFANQNLAADVPMDFPLSISSTTPAGTYYVLVDIYHDYFGNLTNSVHLNPGTVVIQ